MSQDDYDDDVKRMVYEIHGDVKKINQHLDTLNGKVKSNQEKLSEVENKTNKNSKKISLATGVAITVSSGIGVAVSYMGVV